MRLIELCQMFIFLSVGIYIYILHTGTLSYEQVFSSVIVINGLVCIAIQRQYLFTFYNCTQYSIDIFFPVLILQIHYL